MGKHTALFLAGILLTGALAGCSNTEHLEEYEAALDALEAIRTYEVLYSGAIRFEEGVGPDGVEDMALNYTARETWTGEELQRNIKYYNSSGRHLFDWGALYTADTLYVDVQGLYHRVFDLYNLAEEWEFSAEQLLDGNRYITAPHTEDLDSMALDPVHVLTGGRRDLLEEDRLEQVDGGLSFTVTGQQLDGALYPLVDRLLLSMEAMDRLDGGGELLFGPLGVTPANDKATVMALLERHMDGGDLSLCTYRTTLSPDIELGHYAIEAVLSIPELFTLHVTMDLTATDSGRNLSTPETALTALEFSALLDDFTRDDSFLGNTDLDYTFDLPPLSLLSTAVQEVPYGDGAADPGGGETGEDISLLIHYTLTDSDGDQFPVALIADSQVSAFGNSVYSYTGSLAVQYMSLPEDLASEILGFYVLEDLDEMFAFTEEADFALTPLRLSRDDSAGAVAVSFEDMYTGQTVNIYLVQTIPGTGKALYLNIITLVDELEEGDLEALDELGGLIGLDLSAYVTAVLAEPGEAEPTP